MNAVDDTKIDAPVPATRAAKDAFRCGYVAIVGRPNVGKSTLLNRILGQKLSITSPKPQTTRHRILGIKTSPDLQTLYVDTPGMHSNQRFALNRMMNRAADSALLGVDAVVFVVEALRWSSADERVLDRLKNCGLPVLLVVNKVDRVKDKTRLLPFLEEMSNRFEFRAIVPLSARRGRGVEHLEGEVRALMPTGGAVFGDDEITDRSVRFLAAEIVREKLTRRLAEELPYRVGVEIERFIEDDQTSEIGAVIWVDRKSHKPIVVGKDGSALKEVGIRARRDIETMLGHHVRLELWVKVKDGWSDDERAVMQMGYGE